MRVLRLLPVVLVLACAAGAAAQQRDARAKGGFVVGYGKEIKIKGKDLIVGFVSVTQDSRCPEEATCVWAGNARLRMTARNTRGEHAEFDLNTNLAPFDFEFGGYTIALEQLTPRPSIHGMPKPEDYAASLVVAKAGKK